MLDIQWLEEEFVDACWGAGFVIGVIAVSILIGVGIGWWIWG